MSYDIERIVLSNFIKVTHSDFGLSPFGLDSSPVNLGDNSGFMTIIPGNGRQVSTGAPGANKHDYAGVLAITILTKGENGAADAAPFIDSIITAFTGLKLDETGSQPDATSAVVIDFGRSGLVPHVASKRLETPYLRTVVNCPFVRTERK